MVQPRVYTTTAIILKRKSVGEADKVVTVLAKRYGKLRLIAKGVRKIKSRRGGYLEVFSESIVTVHKGKTWDVIGSVSPKYACASKYTQLSQIAGAYFMSEVVDILLPDGQVHDDVYEHLSQSLHAVADHPDTIIPILYQFSSILLLILGYANTIELIPSFDSVISTIENVAERKLKTKRLLLQSGLTWK